MLLRHLFIAVLAIWLTGGCATTTVTRDIEVNTESNPLVNLATRKTYAWIGSAEVINDPYGNWEPPNLDADRELRILLHRELSSKGLQEDRYKPDLLLIFGAGIDMANLEVIEDPENRMESLKNMPKGALIVIMLDAATRQPIWISAAVGDIKSDRTAEEVRIRLDYAVRKMFEDWPKIN